MVTFWLVASLVGVYFGPQFLNATKTTFDAPEGTPSYYAQQVLTRDFAEKPLMAIVYVHNTAHVDVRNPWTHDLTFKLEADLLTYPNGTYVELMSYYTYLKQYKMLADNFVSRDNSSMFLSIQYYKRDAAQETEFIEWLLDKTGGMKDANHRVGLTGVSVLMYECVKGTSEDMVRQDAIVLPLALAVLAYILQSIRLMILPVIGVGTSMVVSWSIMYGVAMSGFDVASVAPSIMSSLVIAMSIDYCLFQLTRYREEINKGRTAYVAAYNMTRFAGHIVFVSGSTLAVTFLGLAFFPLNFLQSVGYSAAVALSVTIMVNLSLIPALILCFPNFFTNVDLPVWCAKCCACQCFKRNTSDYDHLKDLDEIRDKELEKQMSSFWFKSAQFSTTTLNSWLICLIVFACTFPLGLQLLDLKTTIDSSQLFPSTSPSLQIYTEMNQVFSPGEISPYQIIMTSEKHGGVWTESYFDTQIKLVNDLLAHGIVPRSGIRAVSYVNRTIPFILAEGFIYLPWIAPEISKVYQKMFVTQTNYPSNSSSMIDLIVDFDPLGDNAGPWLKDVRALVAKYNYPATPYKFYVTGGAAQAFDAVERIYELFPTEIALTAGIVFVIVGVMFRSLFVPLRLLITIALPICLVFGLGVLVFEQGLLFWAKVEALYWLAPVMSFSILVGLGLDYDVFLFSRVAEYRRLGYSDRAAILKGVYRTGGIITAAGIIMAIAFTGPTMSNQLVLNEFGFMLCVAVLVDTFVVRTLMVPAVMHLAGWVNWWPGRMPVATKDHKDMEEDDDEEHTGGMDGRYGMSHMAAAAHQRGKKAIIQPPESPSLSRY